MPVCNVLHEIVCGKVAYRQFFLDRGSAEYRHSVKKPKDVGVVRLLHKEQGFEVVDA